MREHLEYAPDELEVNALRCYYVYFISITLYFLVLIFLALFRSSPYCVGVCEASSWRIGDWLINYSGGFVRRGLSGHVILAITDLFNFDVTPAVVFVQIFFYSLTLLFIWALARRQTAGLGDFLMLIVSPAFVSFMIFNPDTFRKELLFFALLAALAFFATRNPTRTMRYTIISLSLMPLLILTHEMLVLLTPYLFLVAKTVNPDVSLRNRFLWIPLGLILLATVLVVSHPGNETISLALKNDIISRGIPVDVEHGAFDALQSSPGQEMKELLSLISSKDPNFIQKYIIVLFLASIPFFFHSARLKRIFLSRESKLLLLATLAGTLFLMSMACDWGRFLHIHVVALGIVLLSAKPDERRSYWHSAWPAAFLVAMCVLYGSSWRLSSITQDIVNPTPSRVLIPLFDAIRGILS